MFYADLRNKPEGPFKRLTGVRPATFLAMGDALKKHLPSGGRTPKLCLEDRLLLTLMYWREYRTQAHIAGTPTSRELPHRGNSHIAGTYSLSEAAVCRTIRAVESALMRSGAFRLPGKKTLTKSDAQYQVIVIDATECPD